jgi:IS5 family transposase
MLRIPDRVSILRFGKTPSPRHLLEEHDLSPSILQVINAKLAAHGLLLKGGDVEILRIHHVAQNL